MSAAPFVLLVSDTLKHHLDSLPRSDLERIREKFDFLSSGLWEGGLRVKKLRGSASVVFEARVSKGDRLLFTLGREAGESRIYAWGIERHDDVDRAKLSILPGNAPFLSFEAHEIEEREDLDLDTLDSSYCTQEPFEAVTTEDCGPQRWRVVEDGDWDRLLASADRAELDFRLHLTEAQRSVLAAPPPLLLSGTAGSGKTTIAVYYLFRALPDVGRRLFLTWHPYLCAHSERLYDSLAAGRPGSALARPRFAPWRELILEIAFRAGGTAGRTVGGAVGGAARSFEASREVDLPWFERSLRERKEFAELDPELAWEEIRGIIKGAKPSLSLPRISQLLAGLEGGGSSAGGLAAGGLAAGGQAAGDRRELGELLQAVENLEFLPKIEALIERRGVFPNYADFMRSFASPSFAERAEALLVFRSIREQLERRKAETGRSLLSFAEYQALGKKRAPRYASDRARIYAAAEWYEGRLREGGLWDDIDLTRHALAVLDAEASRAVDRRVERGASRGVAREAAPGEAGFEPWDLVVCDEAQDFTNVHFQLMFRLVDDPGSVVLAGDIKQTINPSGFRWGDVRTFFWERGIAPPDIFRLDLNFRSVGGIVALGNALLDLKKRLAGIQSDESKERWKFQGLMPCLLSGIPARELASAIPQGGASNAIIVRDATSRDEVKSLVGTEFVFTVSESKGLEFDATLLWNLTPATGETAGLWRRVAADGKAALGSEARIAHEINLYYVAVTRARNGLVVHETNGDFWGLEEFAGLFVPSGEKDAVATYWTSVSSPAEWRERGDYYAEREHWMAAAECYRNSGDAQSEARSRARGLLAARRFAEAAPLFEIAGQPLPAAEAWEGAGEFGKAAGLWSGLGEAKRAERCEALGLEKKGSHAAAAAIWLRLKDRTAAARALARAEFDPAAGDLYRSLRIWDKAAACYAKSKRHRDAAECHRKAGDQAKAADSYLAAGDAEAALRFYRLAGEYKKEAECLERLGRHDVLAKRSLLQRDVAQAIEHYHSWLKGDDGERRAALLAEAEILAPKKPLDAAARFSALGLRARAAELFLKLCRWALALPETIGAGDHLGAATCYQALRLHAEAAKEQELAGRHDEATVNNLRISIQGASYGNPDRKKAEAMNLEAQSFTAKGDSQRALSRFQAIGHIEAALPLFKRLDRDDEAFTFCARYDAWSQLERLVAEKPDFRLPHEFIVRQMSELRGYWYGENESRARLIMLTVIARGQGGAEVPDEKARAEIDLLLPLRYDQVYLAIPRENRLDLVDFLLRVGHLNALFLVWRFSILETSAFKAFLDAFAERVEKAALEESPRAPWFAALLVAMRRRDGALSLPKSEFRAWKTIPGYFGNLSPDDALDWYRETGPAAGFDAFINVLHIEAVAGAHAEAHGDFARAATLYEKAKRWPAALGAYRKAGNEAGVAKALEKSGELEEALALWKKLGKARDEARVAKALAAGKGGKGTRNGGGQLSLL